MSANFRDQIIFGKQLGWLPVAGNFNHVAHGVSDVTGAGTVDTIIALDPGAFANAVKVLILPVSTIVVHQLALTMALMRSVFMRCSWVPSKR